MQELEKEVEQETKEINNEVETELKNTSNNTFEFTQTHQANFGIESTLSKEKTQKEKVSSSQNKSENKNTSHPKNKSSNEPSYNPYTMFPMFNPMMMPMPDSKGGQTPMYYFMPVPVDPSQMPKDYWQNMNKYYPMMQSMFPQNYYGQNSNSKK